jgi:tetratricopeptide (TPR) repeat protein
VAIDQRALDELWDFSDPTASEARLRAAADEATGDDRAELLTQVARSLGLQERYDEASALLDSIGPGSPTTRARIALERGRVHNSAGRPGDAIPLFQAAAAEPVDAFLVVDALHMLAIADPSHAEDWCTRALGVLRGVTDERTLRWHVALHHNHGWALFDAGDPAAALVELETALDAARRWGTEQQVAWALEAVDECRAALP